jgi:hypothetical protein
MIEFIHEEGCRQASRGPRLFGSRHWLKEGERCDQMNCNTYRSEITNERHTVDGCRLDAFDFLSDGASLGRDKFSIILSVRAERANQTSDKGGPKSMSNNIDQSEKLKNRTGLRC